MWIEAGRETRYVSVPSHVRATRTSCGTGARIRVAIRARSIASPFGHPSLSPVFRRSRGPFLLDALGTGFWRRSRSSLPCRFGSIFPSPLFPFGPLAAATAASLPVQIIGMIANINIPFPSGVSEYIRLASIAQLNLEIMQHGCVFGEADNAYYAKVRFCFWLPVFIVAALCVVYATERTVWRIRGSAQSEPPALASDRAERVRDRLCSVGCCMFNFLYVQRPSLRVCSCRMWHPDCSQVRSDNLDELVRVQLRRFR